MTKETKHLIGSVAYTLRGLVHDHHDRKHGSRHGDRHGAESLHMQAYRQKDQDTFWAWYVLLKPQSPAPVTHLQ